MFLRYLSEYKRQPTGLVDQIPWLSPLDHATGLISTVDDGLLCGFRLVPYDLGSMTKAHQGVVKHQINNAFKWLGPDYAVWDHERQVPYDEYPAATWPHPVAQLLDEEHQESFTAAGRRFVPEIYVSVWRRAPSTVRDLTRRIFFTQPPASVVDADETRRTFEMDMRRLHDLLRLVCVSVERLPLPDFLRYLHSLISIHDVSVAIPSADVDLGAYLSDCGLTPGILPILGPVGEDGTPIHGGVYLRCLSLSYDLPSTLHMGMLRDLQQLPFSYDAVTRLKPMGQKLAEKVTTKTQINLLANKKSWRAMLHETLTKQATADLDSHIGKQAQDADTVRDEMLSNVHALGKDTMVWVVRHADLAEANRRIQAIQSVLHRHGCLPIDEDLNAVEAFLSTLPGNIHHNVEAHQVTTLNWADLGPWHTPSRGVTWNAHLNGPAIFQARTEGCAPYGFGLHVSDQADMFGVGPKGSGKSTFKNWVMVQSLRYSGTQASGFDVGGSARCVTLCLGGNYYDLGRGQCPLQVMSRLDDPTHYPRIFAWLKSRVIDAGVPWHPDIGTYLDGGLLKMLEHRDMPRTLKDYLDVLTRNSSGFAAMGHSQGNKRSEHLALLAPVVREALRPFARGGVYGDLLDASTTTMAWGTINTFELEALAHREEVYPAVLEYLFPQLEDLLDGRHTLFDFDEAWNIFTTKSFVGILSASMPGWRRKNAHGSFYTQSIAQLKGHPLTPFLMESCQSRVFFPNPKAMDGDILPLYEGLRLDAEEIEANIAMPAGKGFVYVDRSAGPDDLGSKRLIDVRLSPMARAICGANREADHDAMDAILAAHDPHEFAYHWLRHQGFPDAALTVQRALDREQVRDAADLLSVAS